MIAKNRCHHSVNVFSMCQERQVSVPMFLYVIEVEYPSRRTYEIYMTSNTTTFVLVYVQVRDLAVVVHV
jgi:hypothetical protein